MPLYQGYVQSEPDHRISEAKGTHVLKFRLQIGDNWFKRTEVVVFGKLAEKNQDLVRGEYVMLNGDMKENTWNGQSKMELVIGFKGNFKRCKDKPIKILRPPTGVSEDEADEGDADEGVVSAPRSYRKSRSDYYGMAGLPNLDNCPEFPGVEPTDEEYADTAANWDIEFPRWGINEDRSYNTDDEPF